VGSEGWDGVCLGDDGGDSGDDGDGDGFGVLVFWVERDG